MYRYSKHLLSGICFLVPLECKKKYILLTLDYKIVKFSKRYIFFYLQLLHASGDGCISRFMPIDGVSNWLEA